MEAARLEVIIDGDNSGANKALDQTNSKVNKSNTLFKKAAVGFLGVTSGIGVGLGFAINTAADFEAQMSAVGSVTGATGTQFKALEQEALRLGSSTSLSASEAASAMEIMAKAGVPLEKILNGATEDAINLANATGTDIVLATETAATAMTQFGVSSEEAANIISQSANASSLDVNDWALALKSAGPIAAALGIPMEDLASGMMILADNGIRGEVAATAMRNTLQNLGSPTADVAAALNDLGVSSTYANGEFKGLDQIMTEMMPTWKGLNDEQKLFYAEQIAGKDGAAAFLALMGEQEKALDSGTSAFQARKDAMAGVGTAEEQAKARMDNFNGALEEFKGALETGAIILGGVFLPILERLVDKGTDLISWLLQAHAAGTLFSDIFAKLPAPLQTVVSAISTVIDYVARLWDNFQVMRQFDLDPVEAALRAVGIVFPNLYGHVLTAISIWNTLKDAFSSTTSVIKTVASAVAKFVVNALKIGAVRDVIMGLVAGFAAFMAIQKAISVFNSVKTAIMGLRVAVLALNTAFLANPVVLVIAAIVALGVAIYLLYQRFETVRNVVDPVLGVLRQLGSFLMGVLVAGFNIAAAAIGTFIGWIQQGVSAVTSFLDAIGFFDAAMAAVSSIIESVSSAFSSFVGAITSIKDAFSSLMDGDLLGFFSGLGDAAMGMLDVFLELSTAIPSALASAFGSIDWGALGGLVMSGIEGALSGLASLGETIMGWLRSAADAIDWSVLVSTATDIVTGLSGKLGDLAAWARKWISDAASAIDWQALIASATNIVNGLSGKLGDLAAWARKWISDAASAIDWSSLIAGATNIVNGLSGKLGDLAAWARKWISDAASAINWSALVGKASNIVNGLSSKLGDLAAWAKKWISDAASAINWSSLLNSAKNIVNGLSGKLGDLGAWARKWVSDAASSIEWSAIADTATDIVGDIVENLGDIGGALGGWLQDGFDAVQSVWDGRPSWLGGSGKGGGDTSVGELPASTFNGKQIADAANAALVTGFSQLSGDALRGAIENWFWRAIQSLGSSLTDDALAMARNLDTAMQSGMSSLSGGSLATAISGWIGRAATQLAPQLTSQALSVARSLDTAMQSGLAALSGGSLGTSLVGWVARGVQMMMEQLTSLQVGLTVARILDAQITTGMAGLSGASLGSAITAWVGRGMTPVGTSLMALGAPFAQLVNAAFVTGIGGLSGASLGAALSSWIEQAFTTSQTSITTFVSSSIAVLGGWATGVTTNVTNTMSSFKSQISSGTSTGKQSFITFVADVIGVMGGWSNGIKTNVTNTMSSIKSTISSGTSAAKQSFVTFGNDARSAVSNAFNSIRSTASSGMSNLTSTIRSGMSSATSAIRSGASSWAGIISGYAGSMASAGRSVGAAAGAGVAQGMLGALGQIRAAASAIVSEVQRAMNAAAQINSPSKMTAYIGEMIGAGLVVGMNDMLPAVSHAGADLANASMVNSSGVFSQQAAVATRNSNVGNSGQGTVVYQTNYYTVTVDDLEGVNKAIDFVSNLDRERQFVFTS